MLEDLRNRLGRFLNGDNQGLGYEPTDTLEAVLQEVHETLGDRLTMSTVDAALENAEVTHPDDLFLIAQALTGDPEPPESLLRFLDLRNSAIRAAETLPEWMRGEGE